jgi:hypothetical protein
MPSSSSSRPATGPLADKPLPAPSPAVLQLEAFLRGFLPDVLPLPDPEAPRGRGRPPLLPAMLLWTGLLVTLLRGFTHQSDLWRLLTRHGLWDFPRFQVTSKAVYQRLQALAPEPLLEFFYALTAQLYAQLPPLTTPILAADFPDVLALDHTVLEPVFRKRQLFRSLPAGDAQLLPGALGCVFDVRRQLWRRLEYSASPTPDLRAALVGLVDGATPGTLFLFDLGYFAFWTLDYLVDADFHYVTRLRQKVGWEPQHVFYDGPGAAPGTHLWDGLVYLGSYRSDRAAHPVRLIQYTVGATTYTYLTSVLDPQRLAADAVCELYRRRWDIEQAFGVVKTELHLHFLWSGHPNAVLLQVYATFVIAQALCALRNQVAQGAAVEVREVSLPLLIRWMPMLAAEGKDPVAEFVREGRAAGYIRPVRGKRWVLPEVPLSAYAWPEQPTPWREPRYRTGPDGPYRAPARPKPAKKPVATPRQTSPYGRKLTQQA